MPIKAIAAYRKSRRLLCVAVIGGLLPLSAAAQFLGFPSIVFDPSSYATLGHIWTEDISTVAKMTATVEQLVKIYDNAIEMYQLAHMMSLTFSQGSRMSWLTMAQTAVPNATRNLYGETATWSRTMNGNPGLVGPAWTAATVPIFPNPFLANQPVGASQTLANLASVEMADGAAVQCAATIAGYAQGLQRNFQPFSALLTQQFSGAAEGNTYGAQLNLLNASAAQQATMQRADGAVRACEVQQQIVANKFTRDNWAETLNFETEMDQATASQPTGWGNSAATIQSW